VADVGLGGRVGSGRPRQPTPTPDPSTQAHSRTSRLRALFGWLANPAWARAPLLLRRFPGLLAAVLGAGFVLAAVSASQALFVSSAENQALHANLAGLCPWTGGLAVSTFQPISPAGAVGPLGQPIDSTGLFEQRDRSIDHAIGGIDGLGAKEISVFGSVAQARSNTARVVPLVRLMSRDGFRSHITVIRDAHVPGVWVPDDTAAFLKLSSGDPLTLKIQEFTTRTRVAGIYRSMITQQPGTFWCSKTTEIYGLDPNSSPPGILLTDRATMFALSKRLHEGNANLTWEFPVRMTGLTLPAAERLSAQTAGAQQSLSSTLHGATIFSQSQVRSDLQAVVPQVQATIDQIRSPAFSVALAGRIVALLVLAAIGFYWLDRRRTETTLFSAKGIGPFGISSKAALETVLPLALASVAGWFAAIWVVKWLGPGNLLSQSAPTTAAWSVAWTALVGLLLLAVTVAAAVRAADGRLAGATVLARTPWDLVILLLMAASLYEILTRGGGTVETAGGQTKVDILLILFPILFVGGASALIARALRRLLPRLRASGGRRSPAVFLATRRLTAATGIALALITAVALSVGILAYSGTLSASTQASSQAKARVFVGSDVRTTLLLGAAVPAELAPGSTIIRQDDAVEVQPGQVAVSVLEVDPKTFARAAYWDSSFSNRPLAELLQELAKTGTGQNVGVPALVVGGSLPNANGEFRFTRTDDTYRYHVVGTAKAFPLQTQHQVFVVVDGDKVRGEEHDAVAYLLSRGDLGSVTGILSRNHVPSSSTVSAQQVEGSPTVIALRWLYGYLLAMGVVTGLIVLAALVLYLAARQRGRVVSYALARRMGLRSSQHRRSLLLEIAGMLLVGAVLGAALAAVGAWLVVGKLDPLPNLPPPALYRLPWGLYLVTFGVLLVAAWLGSWIAQRSAERANVAEVMRLAA
jgi:putative ABC transport system permease protein